MEPAEPRARAAPRIHLCVARCSGGATCLGSGNARGAGAAGLRARSTSARAGGSNDRARRPLGADRSRVPPTSCHSSGRMLRAPRSSWPGYRQRRARPAVGAMTGREPLLHRLDCLEGPDGCRGEVLMRWPGYGDRCWPRCEKHGNARLEREEENIYRNSPDGPSAPWGFDEYAAGESWEDAA